MSRQPARAVAGNRVWTMDGSVWAIWRLTQPSYPFLSLDGKLALHAAIREALATLPQRSQLLGVHRRVDAAELARRVGRGAGAGSAERWRRAAAADLRSMVSAAPVERRIYLLARIIEPRARTILESAATVVADALGLVGPAPVLANAQQAQDRSDEVAARLSRTLRVSPVGAEELSWLYRRAFRRGRPDDEPPPTPHRHPAAAGDRNTGPQLPRRLRPGLADGVLFEGGTTDDQHRPRHRRYLRVDTDEGHAFQTTLVVSEMPAVFDYPGGGEWFAAADLAPFGVDWTARIDAVPNAQAQLRARRQQRQLTAQVAEYAGEPAGPPRSLALALGGIGEEQAALTAHPGDPELEVTIAFTIWGPDVATLDARAAQLGDLLEPWGFILHRPTGGQVAMFGAGLPASTPPAVCADYVQYMLPGDLAAGAPLSSSAVGDPQGIPLGLSVGGGLPQAILLDPAFGPATNRSGSLGAFGALGSGKSFFIKRVVLGTVARGGQVVTIDRTPSGEYSQLAAVVDGVSRIVRLDAESDVGMDPLAMFAGEERVRVALGLLSILTRTTPTDVDGAVLAAAVRAVAADGGRLGQVLDHLTAQDDVEAYGLRRKLQVFTDHPLSRLVFDERPPMRLDADFICFHTPGLSLPDRDAMRHEHLAKQVLPEQLLAQGLLYLIAAVSRTITFADAGRFGAVLVDEAWALTDSPPGRQLLLDTVRDGRKHNAAVWVLSQHPDDLGDDALSHLLGMRALFRQSRGAAPAALRFMGLDVTDDLVELVSAELQTGQCLLRDVRDRVGLVHVTAPADPQVEQALNTTPAMAA